MPAAPAPPKSILVVGAGCFGAATVLSLVDGPYRGHEHLITILDRSHLLGTPASDAASFDYNKILRQDYTDPFYAELAKESLKRWRGPGYNRTYHECGVMMGSSHSDAESARYIQGSLAVNSLPGMQAAGLKAYSLATAAEIKQVYGRAVTGDFEGNIAYYNEAGGWADSRMAVVDVLSRVRARGVKFASGEAASLLFSADKKDVKGVTTKGGEEHRADFVILASGAWTGALVPEIAHDLLATGQTVGTIQLSAEEAEEYATIPITLLLDTGFYCFPPNKDGVFKFAIHDGGWLDPQVQSNLPSMPRTALTVGCERQQVPEAAKQALLRGLRRVFPKLATKEWLQSRLCWYTDRASGDWLIDYHPSYPSLFLATGGSGHAFKFFPVLGDLCLAGLERRLTPQQASYFSFAGDADRIDKSRGETALVRKVLDPLPIRAKL